MIYLNTTHTLLTENTYTNLRNGESSPPPIDTRHMRMHVATSASISSSVMRKSEPELTFISLPRSSKATSVRSIKSLVPLLDRVLVQRVKAEAKTASGIFLPESSVKELNEAKVLAVGPGALDKKGNRLPMGVAVGDRVLIPPFGGSPVKAGEEEYQLFRDSE